MSLKNFLRPLALACALTATLSACNSGTKEGSTNVERGNAKKNPAATTDGDSTTAGLTRDTIHHVTGKELYKAAGDAKDRNHDGIAD